MSIDALHGVSAINTSYEPNKVSPKNFMSEKDDLSQLNNEPVFAPLVRKERAVTRRRTQEKRQQPTKSVSRVTPEILLKEMSYEPLSSFVMKDDRGETVGYFIEAVNSMGSPVLIETDEPIIDATEVQAGRTDFRPEYKKELFQMVYPTVKGVCIRGGESVCILTSESTKMEERSGINKNSASEITRILPIVTMEEIIGSRGAVIESVDKVSTLMGNKIVRDCIDIQNTFMSEYTVLTEEIHQLYDLLDTLLVSMKLKSDAVRYKLKEMNDKPPTEVHLKRRRVDMMHEQRNIEDMYSDIMGWCEDLGRQQIVIEDVLESVRGIRSRVDKKIDTSGIELI